MRSVVLGGAGFLGSHLCERLLERGDEVLCMDDLSTGSLDNVLHLRKRGSFSFRFVDVLTPMRHVERYGYVSGPVDRVYHLACPASPRAYGQDPVRTMLVNVVGTKNALVLASSKGARLFFASTSEVYGDPEVYPQTEDYRGNVSATGPRACYDEGKRAAEALCRDFVRTRGTEVRIGRIFNTYGPRMAKEDGRVVPEMISRALKGEPVVVHGEGDQTRSLCYVDDLIEGILRLTEHPTEDEPVNLGSDEEITILSLAKKIRDLVRPGGRIIHAPLPEDDPRRRRPSLDRARRTIGYRTTVSLDDGLRRTIDNLRRRHMGHDAASLIE